MKGYGIFVGVNEVDPEHYENKRTLECAEKDVQAMSIMAQQKGYANEKEDFLVGSNATWEKLKARLRHYAELSWKEEGMLLAYFSGHGYSVEDPYHPDGAGKCSQFLCFYDRMVLENEIRRELSRFKSNFKIILILDSCYSGGVPELVPVGIDDESKYMKSDYAYKEYNDYYKDLLRESAGVRYHFEANICYLSACEDGQKALIGKKGEMSNYTKYLMAVLQIRKYTGNYYTFNTILKRGLQKNSSPHIWPNETVAAPFFLNTVPFGLGEIAVEVDSSCYMVWQLDMEESKESLAIRFYPPGNRFYLINEGVKIQQHITSENIIEYLTGYHLTADLYIIVETGLYYEETRFKKVLLKKSSLRTGTANSQLLLIINDVDHQRVVHHRFLNINIPLQLKSKNNELEHRNV